MKLLTLFALLLTCTTCHADPLPPVYHPLKGVVRDTNTVFGTDAYSKKHPGDSSHAPTEDLLESWHHSDASTFDADGHTVRYVWVPGTDHDHRIYVEGAGYSHVARQWIAQHWRIGHPPPAAETRVAYAHMHPASSPAGRIRSVGPIARPTIVSPRPLNPYAIIAGLVVAMLAAGVLGAVLSRRAAA